MEEEDDIEHYPKSPTKYCENIIVCEVQIFMGELDH